MAEAEIVVDVEGFQLSNSMQRKLNTLWGEPNKTNNFTIFYTPPHVYETKEDLFGPSVISIGPFHHDRKSFRAMEEKKWWFLRDFLSRGDHVSLDLCISEMKLLEERTRRCYSITVDLDSDDFVKMMLLDGCFVLEYFLKRKEQRLNSIFEVGWNYAFIYSDLMLLENQIPFFVVEKLYEIGVKQEGRINFVNDLLGIITVGPTYYPTNISNPPAEIHHLLHLFHHCSVPYSVPDPVVSSSKSFCFYLTRMLSPSRIKYLLLGFLLWVFPRRFPGFTSQSSSLAIPNSILHRYSSFMIPCASDLQDAGIKFRQKSDPRHMLDISFDNGVLEIPRQVITGTTKKHLANLIALEQSNRGQMPAHLTCFAVFLDLLVNTKKDVMILQRCGILHNSLSSEEELTNFFNHISKGTSALLDEENFLAKLYTKVNRYCESSWNRQRATLIHDYFNSPWAVISFVAALVLLVLTGVQSFFAIYPYYVPSSS